MRELQINNKIYKIAENFNELSKEQLLFFIDNFYLKLPNFIQKINGETVEVVSEEIYYAAKIIQLWNLLRIDYQLFEQFSEEDIYFLIEEMKIIDFLFENSTLTKNQFLNINSLVGPDDNFGNLTAGEYLWTDLFYTKFRNGDENALNALIATLYRDRKKEKVFNHKTIQSREKLIYHIKPNVKIAILLWYEGCMHLQKQSYKEAFEGGGKGNFNYNDLLLQVAKDGPFGDYNSVCQTNIALINQEMVRLKREADDLKEKLGK